MSKKKKQYQCYWCGRIMTDERTDKGDAASTAMTIEHMSSRYARSVPGVMPKVFACRTCNQLRSKMECLIVNPPSDPKKVERYPEKVERTLRRLPPRMLWDIQVRFPVNF